MTRLRVFAASEFTNDCFDPTKLLFADPVDPRRPLTAAQLDFAEVIKIDCRLHPDRAIAIMRTGKRGKTYRRAEE